MAAIGPKFINPEPITVKGIKQFNPALFYIYVGKKGNIPKFCVVAEKTEGASLGTIFKKAHKLEQDARWLGKIGALQGRFGEAYSLGTRIEKDTNLDVIFEKLAYDLFYELGRGFFKVPKTRLSLQPVSDKFLKDRPERGQLGAVKETVRIMSRYIKGYHDLGEAKTLLPDCGLEINFKDYLFNYHRPPEKVLTPDGRLVPIQGVMELLAVGRCLADIDILGGRCSNAGFVWELGADGVISHARAVKIDPGYAFYCIDSNCGNLVMDLALERSLSKTRLENLKDMQTCTMNSETRIEWGALSESQQSVFLATLLNTARYIESDGVLELLFYRQNEFNMCPNTKNEGREGSVKLPFDQAQKLMSRMKKWVLWQLDIYAEPLAIFKQAYPEQSLRIQYIDDFGEVSLPLTDETYPIRELFTELRIIRRNKNSDGKQVISMHMSRVVALDEVIPRVVESDVQNPLLLNVEERTEELIDITQLFDDSRRVLLVGAAGIGKSTLCQHIAHSWASGVHHRQFTCVYWIQLSELNHLVAVGSKLHMETCPDRFIAKAISATRLNAELEEAIMQKLKHNGASTLILFDGYDEASEELRLLIDPMIAHPEFHIFVSSRPGFTDHLDFDQIVENTGLSNEHIATYCRHFSARKQTNEQSLLSPLHAFKKSGLSQDILRIPLMLQMLCSLWEQGQYNISLSLTELYGQMLEQLCRFKWLKTSADMKKLPEFFSLLGKLAMQMLGQNSLVFSQQEVGRALEGSAFTEKDLLESGLVKAAGNVSDKYYQFIHLSYQEYLAAHHIGMGTQKQQDEFISQHRNSPKSRLVIIFLAGQLYRLQAASIKAFCATLCQDVLIGEAPSTIELAMQCLSECVGFTDPIPSLLSLIDSYPGFHINDHNDKSLTIYSLACQGKMQALKWLYAQRKEISKSISENDKDTLLTAAAEGGQLKVMEWASNIQPDLMDQPLRDGATLLHATAVSGNIEAMEWILKRRPEILNGSPAPPPLQSAVAYGHLEAIKWLLDKYPSSISATVGNVNYLHIAAAAGHTTIIEFFLDKCPDMLEAKLDNGYGCLSLAVQNGHAAAARLLLSKDEKLISQIEVDDYCPVSMAVGNDYVEVVKLIFSKRPDLLTFKFASGIGFFGFAVTFGAKSTLLFFDGLNPTYLDEVEDGGPLLAAAIGNQVSVMKWLLRRNPALVHQSPKNGVTALHQAARNGSLDSINFLLQHSPDMADRLAKCINLDVKVVPWVLAALEGHHESLAALLERCPHPQSSIKEYEHLLARNLFKGSCNTFQLLLNYYPDLISIEVEGASLLHTAATYGYEEIADLLIERRPDFINKECSAGFVPYSLASVNGFIEMSKKMTPVDPRKRLIYDLHILKFAALCGRLPVVTYIWEGNPRLARIQSRPGESPLLCALSNDHLDVVKYLLVKAPIMILCTTSENKTVLGAGISWGSKKCTAWLIEKYPELIAQVKEDGTTPMHIEADKGQIDAIKLLIAAFPQLIDQSRADGLTPIHLAAAAGSTDVIKGLSAGNKGLLSRLSKNEHGGLTPMHMAAAHSRIEVMEWLYSQNPRLVSKTSKGGWTPMHQAALRNEVESLNWLYSKNPQMIFKRDLQGCRPFDIAKILKKDQAMEWLSQIEKQTKNKDDSCVLS